MFGTNQVEGQVGFVLSSRERCTSSGKFTVKPSAICRTGPSPLTTFKRHIVTGIPPRVVKSVDQPPPGKYPRSEGHQRVASRHRPASSGVISQYGRSAGCAL